jgi:hypothetical protein
MDKDRQLTTAEIARRGRSEERTQPLPDPARQSGREARAASGATAAVAEPEPHPFFADDEGRRFQALWHEVQVAFVDDPQGSVQKADELVAQVIQRLAEVFADERGGLESRWSRGTNVSTEELRVALRRYRAFFDRLLSI